MYGIEIGFGKHAEPKSPALETSDGVLYRNIERNSFSEAQIKELLERSRFKCGTCGIENKKGETGTALDLEPHLILPISKGGEINTENATMLCDSCHTTIHDLADEPFKSHERLTKTNKKKLWQKRGRACEECGLELVTGGPKRAIHPFHPADWNGELNGLKILCSSCLGRAASQRDKILKFAEKLRTSNYKQL